MDLGLTGKVAIVAASSKGLGFAVARALASEGCRVCVSSRSADAAEAAARTIAAETGAHTLGFACDVTRAADCERLVTEVASQWGGADILINNSGGPAPGPFDAADENTWQQAIDSTLMNVVRMSRLCIPHMKEQKWGRIITITSTSAVQPIDNLMLSNALRGAVHGLCKTLATELAPFGILVNCVMPGMHATDRLAHLSEARAKASGRTPDEEYALLSQAIPLGRLGDPRELAAAVAFLASERASFITGTSLVVDGGATRGLT
ncbi:MAG: SDR family oxidoreductase [Phycisphaeraceae bacterium]|nr:SDR family oxidoreductase [Phycisphaeraceae bacterium]